MPYRIILCKNCAREKDDIESTNLFEVLSCEPLPDQDDTPEDKKKCKIKWKMKL